MPAKLPAPWDLETAAAPPRPALPHEAERVYWEALFCTPQIAGDVWIAPSATVIGRVRLAARSSVWFGCVLRGDDEFIDIGADTNIQDGTLMHIDAGYPCVVGERVTIGHQATVHGCTVEDDVMIGTKATLLSGARIGAGALIAAGALVLEGAVVPAGTVWAGSPARQLREVDAKLRARMDRTWRVYANSGVAYRLYYAAHNRQRNLP